MAQDAQAVQAAQAQQAALNAESEAFGNLSRNAEFLKASFSAPRAAVPMQPALPVHPQWLFCCTASVIWPGLSREQIVKQQAEATLLPIDTHQQISSQDQTCLHIDTVSSWFKGHSI